MLDVICWKWRPTRGYRSQFGPDTVNVLKRMLQRNLHVPFRFSCITDDAAGIDSDVRIIPLWNDFANVPNPSSPRNPSCYRRLKMFSKDARELIGERIVSLDLDVVITGDVTELFDRDEEFVIWGGQSVQPQSLQVYNWFNGSMMYLRAGTRTQVWDKFDPARSPWQAHRAGCRGSDQGWICYVLGRKERVWTTGDGVYSYRNHVLPNGGRLPEGAKIVAFHGQYDPWQPRVQQAHSWVREHYR